MLAINQILQNRYRIIRQLGHGGMGAVYEAIDERFGEPIALKEIIIDLSDPRRRNSILKAFEREAKSLAKASHESIPFVRDYFSEMNRQFLVMELISGSDLGEMLAARGTYFPVEDALKWLDQILDALDYLHTLEPPIIHRDIKPHNLKLTSRRKIKLLDFGIVKSNEAGKTETSGTFAGATLEYSPIEQILPVINPTFKEYILMQHPAKAENILAQNTDGRCDLYALGATFYHLLTNKTPVDATKRALDIWSGNPDSLSPPSDLNPSVPKWLSDYILKAMAVERDDRFSSALEMRQVLQSKIQNLSVYNSNQDLQSSNAPEFKVNSPTKPELINFPFKDSSGDSISNAVTYRNSSDVSAETIAVAPDSINAGEIRSNSNKNTKLLWLLPALALIILASGAIGAMLWINNSSEVNSNQSSSNSNQSFVNSAAPSPSIEPAVVSESSPSAEPEPSASSTPATSDAKKVTTVNEPESPAIITPTKKNTPEPTAKSVAEKPTNSPTKKPTASPTKKPPADPNCVFTNSCK